MTTVNPQRWGQQARTIRYATSTADGPSAQTPRCVCWGHLFLGRGGIGGCMVKKLQVSILPAAVVEAVQQQRELDRARQQIENSIGMTIAQWRELQDQRNRLDQAGHPLGELKIRDALQVTGWKSDSDVMRDALRHFDYTTNLLLLARWVQSDDQQTAASEIVGILQADEIHPDLAESWIDAHRDEMTPALLAAIIRTAMEHQRHVTAAKGGETRRKNGRPARMLERYNELGQQGVIGERRDKAVIAEFGGNPANLHSTLSKARRAQERQG